METIEIEITHYAEETPELQALWETQGLQAFDSLQVRRPTEGIYHVDPTYLFSNQYNTLEGIRIYERCSRLHAGTLKPLGGYYISRGLERLRSAQKNQWVCGRCGSRYNTQLSPAPTFCERCLGSEHLKKSELFLLRLTPVYPGRKNFTDLSDAELTKLLPKYKTAQAAMRVAVAAKKLTALKAAFRKKVSGATARYERYTWLLEREIITDVIYYDHTDTLSFGWRTPLSESEIAEITEKMRDCPYQWNIKYGGEINGHQLVFVREVLDN